MLPPWYRQQLSRGRSAVHWTRFTPISANRSMFCPVIRSSFTTSSYFVRHRWRLRLATRFWTKNSNLFMILATSEKQRIDLVILRLTSTFSYPFYSSHRITSLTADHHVTYNCPLWNRPKKLVNIIPLRCFKPSWRVITALGFTTEGMSRCDEVSLTILILLLLGAFLLAYPSFQYS